jgi:hypothetical protein
MAYVPVRWGGYGVREVAEYFRGDPTTIRSLLSRCEQNIQEQAERYRRTDLRSHCLVIQVLTVRRGSRAASRLKSGAGNFRYTPLAKIQF